MSDLTITRAARETVIWTADVPFAAYFRQFGESYPDMYPTHPFAGVKVVRFSGDEDSVSVSLFHEGAESAIPVSHFRSTNDRSVLEFLEQYAPEVVPVKVVHMLDTRVIAPGVEYPAYCGARILNDVLNDLDWDSTEDRGDVTCSVCADAYDEQGFERDEERRLEQAGMASYDRAVDRDIESRRER